MKTMCPPGYHHNGFVATHALGHMMYIYMIYIYIHMIYIYTHTYTPISNHWLPCIHCNFGPQVF